MFRKFALPAIILVALATGRASAQNFEKPGSEHDLLKQTEGNWDCVMKMQGQESKCSATYKAICGGMWIESDFKGDLGGLTFQGHGLDGYDQKKKKYIGVWVDSLSSSPMYFTGDYDKSTKTLTMAGESVGMDGKPEKVKNTTTWKDKDHFTFTMYMIDPKGKEQQAFTIEYTRKK